MASTSLRLAEKTVSSAVKLGVLQSPAIKLSAKPISPDFSAAPNTFQLCRVILASSAIPSGCCGCAPKRRWEPSGSVTVSAPWRRFCSNRNALRAAAGAPSGMLLLVELVVAVFMDGSREIGWIFFVSG